MEKGDLKIDEETVVHCATEELANQVLAIADKLGYTWSFGQRFIGENRWELCQVDTCYNLHIGTLLNTDYYIEEGFNIIEADEFIKLHEETNKEDETDSTNIDWEQRRWELIKEIYAKCCLDDTAEKQIELSIYYANELIEKLKNE